MSCTTLSSLSRTTVITDAHDNELISAIISAAPDGLVVVDREGRIVLVNPQVERMLGYGADELLGEKVELLVPDSLRVEHERDRTRYVANPSLRPMTSGLDLTARHKDGSQIPVEISLSPLVTAQSLYTIASVRDITDRLETEQALRDAHEAVQLAEERERIARDLHDTVIQHLFATGMSLQAIASGIDDDKARERLTMAVDDLDETIRQVRTAIFGLRNRDNVGESIKSAVIELIESSGRMLGFRPELSMDGPIDTRVSPAMGEHLLPTLHEALSNVSRHARAHRARVGITVNGDLVLSVSDDGIGLEQDPDLSSPGWRETRRDGGGLQNMAARAKELGGCLIVGPGLDGAGTCVTWRVPLKGAHRQP
ncbi:MAG: hypothetical protein JJLCMIEE_02988 [Acidimicrobiales bacterium]|nr:MAG: PAS domain S-box protein [Actinomycetota bacterium]MBV6509875.1 hypothetical protein [Acidimicrobiales bacterium]RIK06188.1 MAG: hypothetical protein DCC48_07080 [Acidobacteriota bacterium]